MAHLNPGDRATYGIMASLALQAVGPPYSRHSQATLLSGEWIVQMKSRKSHV